MPKAKVGRVYRLTGNTKARRDGDRMNAAPARTLQVLAARETPRKCAALHGQSLDGVPTFTAPA